MRPIWPVQVMMFALAFGFAAAVQAQSWEMPSDAQRCPSKWGAKDEVGSGNLMKPEMAMKAAKLIRTGEVFTLGFHLSAALPLIGSRRFDMHMKRGTATDPGTRGENEEIVITELGQVGTQLDAFAHQMYGGEYYNCVTDHEMSFSGGGSDLSVGARQGFPKLGVEKIPDIMTRGVLIDVAGVKNLDMLEGGYVITAEDLQQALAKEKLKLEPGDAVIINTGWGKLYNVKDKEKYLKSSPGIGIEAGEWLIKQNPMLVGTDTCCVEVRPYPGQKMNLPIHAMFLIVNGVYLVENLKLEQLAAERAYETAYIMTPLKIEGGTGSTIAPIAVR
ncbi:MAG TPA: cyclase family protein [Candidatus Acidoferrales bacterium]|nr:cyclase family protein [Candidatus Acidoferrales bacterium]